MTMQLDHTIVPSRDKKASARFFADIFGLTVTQGGGYFAQVRINEPSPSTSPRTPTRPKGSTTPFTSPKRSSTPSSAG